MTYASVFAIRNVIVVLFLMIAPVSAAPITLLALGDSLTEGYGLPPEQGYVPQLQAWLAEHGSDTVVLNAGVSGDTTAGGLSRTDWSLTPDVQAVIVNLGGNDMLRGVSPTEARTNLDGILAKVTDKGLPVALVSLRAPGNYGADYKTEFDELYADLATKYGALLIDNYLAPVADATGKALDPALMQNDGIHPNAEGVAKIVARMGPIVQDLLAKVQP